MQIASTRILTRVAIFISYDNSSYGKSGSTKTKKNQKKKQTKNILLP